MLICGAETPLQANPYIPMLDEGTGETEFCLIRNEFLNRYSFVCVRDDGKDLDELETLMRFLFALYPQPKEWIVAWTTPKGLDPNNIAAKTLFQDYAIKTLQKFRDDDWSIHAEEQFPESGIVIATRPVEAMELKGIIPVSVPQILRGRTAAIIGTEKSAEEVYRTEMGETLRITAHRGCFMPSEQFLDWLAKSKASFFYALRDPTERFGLVVITPALLPLDDLLKDGIISLVWHGDAAQKVWSRSPSWRLENQAPSRE